MNTFKQLHLPGARSLNITTHREIFSGVGVDIRDTRAESIPARIQVLV